MVRFFKENAIFVMGLVLLAGLLLVVSGSKQIPDSNQINTDQTPPISTTETTNPQIITDTTSQPTVNTPKPTPPPVINTPVPRNLRGDDEKRGFDD